MMEIKHQSTGAVLYSGKGTLRDVVIAAVKARAYLANADLAGAYLANAYLANAYLANADLAGANLANANLADANLADANLADANLADANLAGANLADADLANAYLANAYLANADLAGAYLANANLADANLANANLADAESAPTQGAMSDPLREPYKRAVTAEEQSRREAERAARYRERHPEIPVIEHLDRKILEAVTQGGGVLNMCNWHTCETTHCRAGWAIVLAGDAGRALEAKVGPHRAGTMLYRAATGRVPHFYATDEAAMADIKACAEKGAGS